jgi:polyisoprenoid-binding protein YceI
MMHKNAMAMMLAASALVGLGMAAAGDDYAIDTAHSGVTFKISHSDLSWVHGRFNQFSGEFAIDPGDHSKSSFTMIIKPESIDTNNTKRDGHLRSSDFFDTKKYPEMKFTSTSVKPIDGGLEVTGDFTLHGETKPVTFNLMGGKTIAAKGKGGQRTGYTAEFKLKRSDFGISKFAPILGDDVWVNVSFQGIKKR